MATMKPWGCQACLLHFSPFFLPRNRERLAGVQGGGNEPPGRRTTRRNLRHGCLTGYPPRTDALGMHSTIRAAARLGRLDVPAHVSGYAAPPLRSDILR